MPLSKDEKIISPHGIRDKFLNGCLNQGEWLSQNDLESGISALGLESFDIQIQPFDAEQIGAALHFAREKHQSDTQPYTIPLIFDLGEDEHSRKHARGSHWTRGIVTIDPTQTPPEVSMTYDDPLELPVASKQKIKNILTEALQYHRETGSLAAGTMKTLMAFPACESPKIIINGASQPQEGYTSGYTTLLSFVSEPAILNNATPRDFIYRTLIPDDGIEAKLTSFHKLEETQEADKKLEAILLSLPETPSRSFEKPEKIELSTLLEYMANNENRFESFYYDTLTLPNASKEELTCLEKHLNGENPYIPFKAFELKFDTSPGDNLDQIKSLLKTLSQKGIDALTLSIKEHLITPEQREDITQFIQDNKITTLLLLDSKAPRIENIILKNRRNTLPASDAPLPTTKQTIQLGPIGKAIFQKNDLSALSAEVQVQEEQQQQVQQQMQSSSVVDDLPDEDAIVEESFLTYSGKEELLNKGKFIETMSAFVINRHPNLTPGQCWDLITGSHANSFKYGIHKMTVSAAKQLVENLVDVQYGLHPDNLPRGFFLTEDAEKKVVLAYDGVNPPINPKESPFTLQFTKPKPRNNWVGDATQFISDEEALQLYKTIYKPNMITTKETIKTKTSTAINTFFDLRNPDTQLAIDQQLTILEKFANSPGLKVKITTLFGNTLSKQNVAALSEILYEQSGAALSEFLDDLTHLKRIKNEKFFQSFKSCFIDSSKNLNELTTTESKTALQALHTQSPAESAWWMSLTEQHTSNLKYNEVAIATDDDFDVIEKPIEPGQRFASLAELNHCFNYFCAQLVETNPPLTLTEFCPLVNVADMRVGLDRLTSSILHNAKHVNEQFYQALESLDLDPMGAFYASRYEGFKLVSDEMAFELDLNTIDSHKKGFNFRIDKENFLLTFVFQPKEVYQKALFLRYIATFNHRAPLSIYEYAFEANYSTSGEIPLKPHAQAILAVLSTGMRGKTIDKKDIDALAELTHQSHDLARPILMAWGACVLSPIKPTLSEVLAISNYIITKHPTQLNCISTILTIIQKYDKNADPFLSALVTLTRSKTPLPLDALLNALNSNVPNNLSLNDQAEMTGVLAICRPDGTGHEDITKKAHSLFSLIASAPAKTDIIELLKNIDVEQSTALPTLDELNQLVTDIITNQPTSYNELVHVIKTKLPQGCIVNTTAALTAPSQPTGNIHAILSKQMGTLINELEKQRSLFGDDFFEQLKTSDGPAFLISKLNDIKEMPPGLINDAMKTQLINFILPLYDSVISNGIEHIGAKGQHLNLLKNLIHKNISHPLKKEKDFNAFIDLFTQELTNIESLTTHLRTLNRNWPTDFGAILQKMSECTEIGRYPLGLLACITQGFANGFDANKPFPINAFNDFFSYTPLNDAAQKNIQTIIDTLLNAEEGSIEASLSNDEKQLLCIIAVQCSKTENLKIVTCLNEILSLKANQPELFTHKLQLIIAKPDSFKSFIKAIKSIDSPDLSSRVLTVFSGDHAHDFLDIMSLINEINPKEKRPEILNILVKATQKGGYDLNPLKANIAFLEKLPSIEPLVSLYAGSIYPNLKQLNDELSKPNHDLDNLQKKYDRDPDGKRSNLAFLEKQFDTKGIASLIDKMRDINHDRPLLYSQRETLQKQFLYINAIGKDHPILTANNEQKAIKDLSHAEIKALLDKFKTLQPKETKHQLEIIAILREVMYRATGNFPRATQILYLLSTLQNKGNFVAQIPTGQGKSLTSAMAAAMMSLNGKTVDITSSNLFLASEGLNENQTFFDYLAIPTALINAESSKKEDYQTGGIHYSSMSDIALYRSKMTLQGKHFSEDSVLIADEVDFSTLDDNTRYRFAKSLDTPSDPDKSPYTWAYEALIRFADTAQLSVPKSDDTLLLEAKQWLKNSAKSKEQKTLLKSLEDKPEVYTERMKTWLIAAGLTKQSQDNRFRIIPLEHKRKGNISKACILTSGRPRINAEFGNAGQQFLHVRLQEQYSAEIKAGTMQDFLVEPEKIYVSTLNSKILMNSYQQILGMTGTAGSPNEIKEQHEKYGFKFVDIPPHVASKRVDLDPILSSTRKLINFKKDSPETQKRKRKESEKEHIEKIVNEIIRHINTAKPPGQCSPMLITCADKHQGELITQKLQEKQPLYTSLIQSYYSSEKATSDERNEEEKEIKKKAGNPGMITISTVFGRGTDIKPTHKDGLYTLKTYVDTQPHSAEDLERAKRQELGRSARGEDKGQARMVIDRNQFAEIPNLNIEETNESLDHAIQILNNKRNTERVRERESRESFDDVKESIEKAFRPFINTINESLITAKEKSNVRDAILQLKSKLLKDIDEDWERIQHQTPNSDKLTTIAEFACKEWDSLQNTLSTLLTTNHTQIPLPAAEALDAKKIVNEIRKKHAPVSRHYVKQEHLDRTLDQTLSSDDVYSEMASSNQCKLEELSKLKLEKFKNFIQPFANNLDTPAHREKLKSKEDFNLATILAYVSGDTIRSEGIKKLMGALLYMRYKAYRDDNQLAYTELSRQCRELTHAVTADYPLKNTFTNALREAQQDHFSKLIEHQGKSEKKKTDYMRILSAEFNQNIGKEASVIVSPKESEPRPLGSGNPLADARGSNSFGKTPTEAGNLAAIKKNFTKTLETYRDHAWFVSKDRKAIATTLITELRNKKLTSRELLEKLSTQRNQILQDDISHKRPISAGLSGRLNQTIDALRTQIIAASDSKTVETFIENEFTDIKNCLEAFQKRVNHEALTVAIEAINVNSDIPMKYQALSRLFTEVEAFAANPMRTKDPSIDALALYCKNKQTELVYYFMQCKREEYQSINHQESIAVFRAASQAGTTFSNAMASPLQPTVAQSKTIQYSDQNVELKITDSLLNWHPNFKRINTSAMYHQLLSKIEKKYVEQHNTDSVVRFSSISLEKSNETPDNVLQVIINLTVDDKPYRVGYLINLDTRLIYTDTQEAKIKNPSSEIDKIQTELEESSKEINELANITDNEIKSITITKSFREKLRTGRDNLDKNLNTEHDKPLFPTTIKNK